MWKKERIYSRTHISLKNLDLFEGESSSSDKVDPFPYWMVTLAHGYQRVFFIETGESSFTLSSKAPQKQSFLGHPSAAVRGVQWRVRG